NISVTISDGDLEDSEVFALTVTPINDPPEISLPDDFTFDEDDSLIEDFNVYLSDLDGDSLILTFAGNDSVTVDTNGFEVIFGAMQDWNGIETMTFTVNDNHGRAVASDTVNVIVEPVNDAPVISDQNPDPLETPEDTSLEIVLANLSVTDVDNTYPDDFTLLLLGGENYTFEGTTITPDTNFVGTLTVPVYVNDPLEDQSNTFDLTVTVSPVNDAPEIIGQVELTTLEEVSLEITLDSLYVTDVDNVYPDGFTLTVLEGEGYTFEVTTITPKDDFYGDLTVPAYVDDGIDTSDVFDLTVYVTNVNDRPVLAAIESQEVAEEGILTIELSGEDADADILIFEAFSDNSSVEVSLDDTTLTVAPVTDYNGTVNITVLANDGVLYDTEVFELTVTYVNDPPTMALDDINGNTLTFTYEEDGTLVNDFSTYVSDVDLIYGDSLSLAVEGNDSVTVDVVGLMVTFGAVENWSDPDGEELVFTIEDSSGATASDILNIFVTPVNDAPVFGEISDYTTAEEMPLTITLSAEDAENDDII
ncbi:uncharacterized protein METZ01_LOCUS212655, partial [marine metagenome]